VPIQSRRANANVSLPALFDVATPAGLVHLSPAPQSRVARRSR
jgi:hypothetical protein